LEDKKTKKEILAQYKEREIIGGVYAITNALNNKSLLEATTDLRQSKNRFDFSQSTGSCVHMKRQSDWNEQNGKQFVFEVIDELKKNETQTVEEFKADIDMLKKIWADKLSDREMY
jgi:membrane carboxypeptidase/penicillin-binding protein